MQTSFTSFISFSIFNAVLNFGKSRKISCKSTQYSTIVKTSLFLSICFAFGSAQFSYSSSEDYETCTSPWVDFNFTGFKEALVNRVYGQPLTGLAEAIQQHWNDSQAAKALVISMHGPTGTGKNYVCQIMANHLYKEGTRSQFYHLYPATLHFHQSSQLLNYMNRLHSWIRGNVTRCPRSVFVFDEVDKMPFRLLDSLQPLLDYHETDQVFHALDFRSAIFIFLFNEGSSAIEKHMLEQKRLNRNRSDAYSSFSLKNQLIKYLHTQSSARDSAVFQQNLVSHYVPFLPLEREHVTGCIEDYMRASQPKYLAAQRRQLFIDRVLKQLRFKPENERFFSESGCKMVISKAQFVQSMLEDEADREKRGDVDMSRTKSKRKTI